MHHFQNVVPRERSLEEKKESLAIVPYNRLIMHQKVRRHTFKGLFGLVSAFGSGKTIKYFLQTFQPSVTDNIGLHAED